MPCQSPLSADLFFGTIVPFEPWVCFPLRFDFPRHQPMSRRDPACPRAHSSSGCWDAVWRLCTRPQPTGRRYFFRHTASDRSLAPIYFALRSPSRPRTWRRASIDVVLRVRRTEVGGQRRGAPRTGQAAVSPSSKTFLGTFTS